jgi:hypothetical protein
MSYQYIVTERRRRTAAGGNGSYGHSGSRSTFGYWVPLVLTVTAATVGIAAWIWSERGEDDEDSSVEEHNPGGIPPPDYATMSGGVGAGIPPGPGPQGMVGPERGPQMTGGPPQPAWQREPRTGPDGFAGSREMDSARSTAIGQEQDTGLVARVSSALGMGRSGSPAQSYDWASKKVVAGVAAAGAMVGGAISTLSGGASGSYEDHDRWSEEADKKEEDREIKVGIKRQGTADEFFSGSVGLPRSASLNLRKRKNVAVVVSSVADSIADFDLGDHAVSLIQGIEKDGKLTEKQSILAHLPEHINPDTTRVFVLIYAPDLKTHPLSPIATRRPSQSMASSFSNISQGDAHTPAQTPGEFPDDDGILANAEPNPIDESSSLYKTLHNQAQALVEKDSMILPFTSRIGHKHILKSLAPELVYVQESLCGSEGEIIADLSGWVRQTVVVIGDEGGQGGLIDTDDEGSKLGAKAEVWWQTEERTGLGKRVAVTESLKIGEDWERRVNERE